ncbi:MAG: uroporphyrinogen decarboxylase family protein [Armatimonadia bacterium]
MTTHERMTRVYNHENPDRVPMHDGPWASTLERWYREGLPAGVGPREFFGWDFLAGFGTDNSPRFPLETVEETEEYRIHTTHWGVTMRNWRHRGSVPEFLDFAITRETWPEIKERMTPDPERVNWKLLEHNFHLWREQGAWITGGAWFGYDVMASWVVGYDRTLIAMADDPEFVQDFINTCLELDLALLGMVWDKGYHFDCVRWPDDMGYRNGLLFSKDMYRRLIKPAQKRMIDWAHERGLKTMLHSCGNIMDLIPDLVEIGLDSLNPLEQKAGMDALKLKREYGDKLVLEGGIDVRNMTDGARIEEEIRTKLEVLKQNGGYIFHSDHSVPEDVSFADFCRVTELARYYGRY